MMFNLNSELFRVFEWITKLAYANFLWIVFTVLGLGIFGFMPATVALFAVTRKWVMKNKDTPVFTIFWKTYRKEFLKSNILGFVLVIMGSILYVDLAYIPAQGVFLTILHYGILALSFLFFILLLYIFPVYVHFNLSNREYIKNAFILGASYPHITFTKMLGLIIVYFLFSKVPGLIPFFTISLLANVVMWFAYQVFKKAEMVDQLSEAKA